MAHSGLPAPRQPLVTPITSSEQLLPPLRTIVKRPPADGIEGMGLQPGEKVLVVSDRTISPLLLEAFSTVIREMGAQMEVIILEGYPQLTDPLDLVDNMFGHNWFPSYVWDAGREADVFLQLAFFKAPHVPTLPFPFHMTEGSKPRYMLWELPPDLLLSDYMTYPVEVREAIAQKSWQLLEGARRVDITDPEGTEITWHVDWQRLGEAEARNRLSHVSIPRPQEQAPGILATSELTFGGPVPRTKFILEGQKVVGVEGGGSFGDRMRESFERYKDVPFPGHPGLPPQPGPGVNWLSTFGICTHPKARPSPTYSELTGSARVHAWCSGHHRSGIIHTAIGSTRLSPGHKLIRHINLRFATIVADGRTVVDKGHLVAMDDPEIERLASRFGDPKRLLTEDWIPALAP